MADEDDNLSRHFTDLYVGMGLALSGWAKVEDALFNLMVRVLRTLRVDAVSILYFSAPSFESRRVLVDRLVKQCVHDEHKNKKWTKISKRLGDASKNRGKLAHYGVTVPISNKQEIMAAILLGEKPIFKRDKPELIPSEHNIIKSREVEKLSVSSSKILEFIKEFYNLEEELLGFKDSLPALPPAESLAPLQYPWLFRDGVLINQK